MNIYIYICIYIAVVNNLTSIITALETSKASHIYTSEVNSRLLDIFGPRGIQHYIYIDIVRQIEALTNAYLYILADSGINISLQDENKANGMEDDKIIKQVYVRSKGDGSYRERALSQLSGGQWRRVALGMDLAFAELVRRRGHFR